MFCRLLEEDSLQIAVLIVPASSFDPSRNPLYKPNKKLGGASSPLHGGNGRASVSPSESSSQQGRDSDGPLMELEMATNSMHEGLAMQNLREQEDEESGNAAHSSSSSSSSSAPRAAGGGTTAAPRQAVSCSAIYSFSVPLAALLSASPGRAPSRSPNPLAASPAPLSVPVGVSEMFLFDLNNQLYSSQEIFGLGPSAASPPATASEVRKTELLDLGGSSSSSDAPPSSPTDASKASAASTSASAASAVANGGKYVAEDCVVCLTDPKEIALLPCRSAAKLLHLTIIDSVICRHLCVCVGCLIYIDKCPVCRAAFEEYVVIQSSKEVSVSVPSLVEPVTIKL